MFRDSLVHRQLRCLSTSLFASLAAGLVAFSMQALHAQQIIADGNYSITNACNGKTLGLQNGNPNPWDNAVLRDAGSSGAITWQVNEAGNGSYSLRAFGTESALQTEYARTAGETNADLWTYGGGAAQRWIISDGGGGNMKLSLAAAPDMALDAKYGGANGETNVWLYGDNGTCAQRWAMRRVAMSTEGRETITPEPSGLAGLPGPYTSASYLSLVEFERYSHWLQPWRGFLETVPAHRFLAGVGMGWSKEAIKPDMQAQMLASQGIRTVRLEIGWAEINYDNESVINSLDSMNERLAAMKRYGLRPLILLNLNQGVPTPIKFFSRVVTQSAAAGTRTLVLDSVADLVVGKSGISDLTNYWAAEALITNISGNQVTLSKPLPAAIAANTSVKMATLKYRPFSPPGTADYDETLNGWKRYVTTVTDFVASALGTAGSADLGFDLEIYNELTFGDKFLYINSYYEPRLYDYDEESIWANLVNETAQLVKANPARFVGVSLTNGFSSTIPWTSSSDLPDQFSGLSKHPYPPLPRQFPRDTPARGIPLGASGKETTAAPAYLTRFPEYYATAIDTATLLRDSAPIETSIYGKAHGRYARSSSKPVDVWITELNINPQEWGITSAPIAHALKAKAAARTLALYLNKGVRKVFFYTSADENDNLNDVGYGMNLQSFIEYARTAVTYPAYPDPYISPSLRTIRRMTDQMKIDLDPNLSSLQTRRLYVESIRDQHSHKQFDAVGSEPALMNREVLAILPYQVNSKRFVIPYYVMTRDITIELPPEDYTVKLDGIHGLNARIFSYDPITDTSEPIKLHAASESSVSLTMSALDYPRLLIIEEQ